MRINLGRKTGKTPAGTAGGGKCQRKRPDSQAPTSQKVFTEKAFAFEQAIGQSRDHKNRSRVDQEGDERRIRAGRGKQVSQADIRGR